jgi:hypothetical protein
MPSLFLCGDVFVLNVLLGLRNEDEHYLPVVLRMFVVLFLVSLQLAARHVWDYKRYRCIAMAL